jgi:transcriptional regulator of arginine metabolism
MRKFIHEKPMPSGIAQQHERRRLIAQLLATRTIRRQAELVDLLRAAGHPATQSSVSRDLRHLGAAKLGEGYSLPDGGGDPQNNAVAHIAEFVRELRSAGPHLLVITTAIGAAQRVAVTLDRTNWPEIIGTVSGDDTIFVATAGAAQQRRLRARLRDSLGTATS